jgi:exodeoxyribonuclease VII large subunit
MDEEPLTITEINMIIKSTLKESFPNLIKISGELFNYKKSGQHMYASIRDSESSLNLIQWKAPNSYSNGDAVTISGYIDYYTKNCNINFIAKQIEMVGDGIEYKKYCLIKSEYESKGYFDKSNKKSFPSQLNKIVLITSVNGAALQDIIYVLSEGKFPGHIMVKNCLVQGGDSPSSIANAIKFITESYPDIDLIMVTRGGGSIEDLMSFSDKLVIEAIYKSNIFILSAVGHQIDSMLSDFVADISAPTPSIGAELLVKSYTNNSVKINLFQSKQIMFKEIILNKINQFKKNRYNLVYTYQQNRIKLLYKKMIDFIKSKLLFLKNLSEKIKLKLDSFNKSQYNCKLIQNTNMIKNINEIQNGIYTLFLNDSKINIEIKIL